MENNHKCGCGHDHEEELELEQEGCECGCEGECDCDGDCDCGCNDQHDHHHHGDHGCGCGHDHDEEYESIHLVLDDGRELECFVLEIFTIDDEDQEYIALLPKGEENVLIYRYNEDAEDEPQLINIEDEEEFQKVSEVFMQIMEGGSEE